MPQELKLAELIFDWDIYPRPDIDSAHVKSMAEAEEAGAEFPPILVEKKSKRVVDGWHRCRKQQRVYGKDGSIMCTLKTYRSEVEVIEDVMDLNATHGKKLSSYDHARCILIADRVGLSDKRLAIALHMPISKISELRSTKIASTEDGPIAIKVAVGHMAGRKLSRKQAIAVTKLGGNSPTFTANQLIIMIEANLIDKSNETLMEKLKALGKLIRTL